MALTKKEEELNQFKLRLAKDSDKASVLKLLNSVFSEQQRSAMTRGDDFWNWKYVNSPFGKSYLTVVTLQDEIVAVANLWPWEFNIRGNIVKGLQPCDSAVHVDFRGRGLFKKTRIYGLKIAKENGVGLIYNYPNKNSLPAYQSLGWDHLGLIPWRVKILRPINLINNLFRESKSIPLDIKDNFAIDYALLDEVARKSNSFDGLIKTNRVEGFHRWRYDGKPGRNYGMISLSEGRKTIAALFTLNLKGNTIEMVVVDLIGHKNLIDKLFRRVVSEAKKMGISFIAIMENSEYQTNQLRRQGFFKKKSKNKVVLPIDLSLECKISSIKNWSLMASMHDSI